MSTNAETGTDFQMAERLFKSRMFKDVTNVEGALAKIQLGRSMGIDPANAMMGLIVAQGRLTMTANLMANRIRACKNDRGRQKYKLRIVEHTQQKCSIQVFERIDDEWEEMGPPVTTTVEEFKFLATGPNKDNWTKYPKNMLYARCISNIAKWHCADAFGGAPVYLPDEIPGTGVEIDGDTLEVKAATPPPATEDRPSQAVYDLCREFETTPEELAGQFGTDVKGILAADEKEVDTLRRLLTARKEHKK